MLAKWVLMLICPLCFACFACSGGAAVKPTENKFYKNPGVRHCLQLDKERKASEAQSCWSSLLARLESDKAYREKTELTDGDLAKIRQQVGQSTGRSQGLRRQLEKCFNISTTRRNERIDCFEAYLKTHRESLSVGERYEVETAISAMKKAREIAAGKIENTVEHAGKLLGAEFHLEEEGIRIDSIGDGPMKQSKAPEQGIIVALDDTPIGDFDGSERISRLEACQDRPVTLLIRQGGIDKVNFTRAKVRCGDQAKGEPEWQVHLPAEVCTHSGSPELSLGISWCYLARDGILEVEEVCTGSAADAAGVHPDQQFISINGKLLLGLSYPQIAELLKSHPAQALTFQARGGALQSPAPLSGSRLEAKQAERFWQALKRSMDIEERPVKP